VGIRCRPEETAAARPRRWVPARRTNRRSGLSVIVAVAGLLLAACGNAGAADSTASRPTSGQLTATTTSPQTSASASPSVFVTKSVPVAAAGPDIGAACAGAAAVTEPRFVKHPHEPAVEAPNETPAQIVNTLDNQTAVFIFLGKVACLQQLAAAPFTDNAQWQAIVSETRQYGPARNDAVLTAGVDPLVAVTGVRRGTMDDGPALQFRVRYQVEGDGTYGELEKVAWLSTARTARRHWVIVEEDEPFQE
jgi:hypothetical protein